MWHGDDACHDGRQDRDEGDDAQDARAQGPKGKAIVDPRKLNPPPEAFRLYDVVAIARNLQSKFGSKLDIREIPINAQRRSEILAPTFQPVLQAHSLKPK